MMEQIEYDAGCTRVLIDDKKNKCVDDDLIISWNKTVRDATTKE